MPNNVEAWYKSIPIITRTYLTLATITSAAVTFDLVHPLHLYLNFSLIAKQYQFWRLITSFLFFDRFGINFFFHVYFLYFYCRRLEEHSFHGRSADFLFMVIVGSLLMLLIGPVLELPFLSHSLVVMILYNWSRRNPHEQLRLYGLVTVSASYLPLVLFVLSFMLGGMELAKVDGVGIVVGHVYWFLTDVLSMELGEQFNLLKTPRIIHMLFPNERDQQQQQHGGARIEEAEHMVVHEQHQE